MRRILIPTLLGLALLSSSGIAAATAPGVQFTQPADWAKSGVDGLTRFTAPEGDLVISIIEMGSAPDAASAVSGAWARVRPGSAPKPLLATPAAPGEGWDERVGFSYETPPAERAVRAAVAQRQGKAWTVVLIDGAVATYAKRSAAVSLLQQSLRPAGYTRETFAGRNAQRLTPERVQLMRDFVAEAAQALGVPGVGLAFVDQGKVVWQGGVGVRELGKPEPVDADTKFMVASNTKGMATLLLSVLADDGKLNWDQQVIDLYPGFRLGDDETTRATLVRHLVCACTGLPRKDYSFILAERGAPASDTFAQLAQTQPTSKFGELFQYNNLMASAAGYLGGALSFPGMELGAAFDKAMADRIFMPLGMRDTGFDFSRGTAGNWAPPHGVTLDGEVVRVSNSFNETVFPHRPAGGAFSTAADMARYVQLELGKGRMPDGKRLVSEASITERRKRGVSVGEDTWYGMGLFERTAWGVPVVTHGGTLQGYHSNFYVLPEAGIGAVILTNADPGSAMLGPFLRRLLEVVYNGQPQAAAEITAAAARLKAQAATRKARLTVPGDPAVLGGLASHYQSAEGFQVHLEPKGDQMMLRAGFIESPVATRANSDGTVSLVSAGAGIAGFDALIGTIDGVRTLTVKDSQHEYVYRAVR
ncbi:MAG: beta-lactamase family protein [Sandarakinorhabdus sp.]|nr:beta-lactamase family protein [Sandarakinorhabdus sp.]